MEGRIGSLRNTWSTILIFALVIGGIYVGVFTPTEAGAIGASGALTIGLINRQLTWSKLVDAPTGYRPNSIYAFSSFIRCHDPRLLYGSQ